MASEDGIDYFRRGHWLTSIQEKVSLNARRKMFNIWLGTNPKSASTILDIGTTPDCERLDSNCFVKWLIDSRFDVSMASPEDISSLNERFPAAKILPKLEFNKNDRVAAQWNINPGSFDWSFSSAVLEHAGSYSQQLQFISECGRVSQNIFLTTPNRWHWLEFHTKLPLIHWLPKTLHRRILKLCGLEFWSNVENLNLLSFSELYDLAQKALGSEFTFQIEQIWTLGMPSNLILIAKRK